MVTLAQQDGGSVWKQLVKQWVKKQLEVADEDTWLQRHSDLARRRRTEAAEERIRVDLGAKPAGGGNSIP